MFLPCAKTHSIKSVAIVGTGPAGLMAAEVITRAGYKVVVFEKKRGPGRKLLIAGSSGLNVSYQCPTDDFWRNYRGPSEHFIKLFTALPPDAWLQFLTDLGIETFCGTSRRHFVKGMKAAPLVRAWTERLDNHGAEFRYSSELSDFTRLSNGRIELRFQDGTVQEFSAVCLALGGGSYVGEESPLRWPAIFKNKGIVFEPFRASNVGFEVAWPAGLLQEAEGLPLKRVRLISPIGERKGDLTITHYGLEGTPIYHVGQIGTVHLDLRPDLSENELLKKLAIKENLAPIRRLKRQLSLRPAALALIYHCTPKDILKNLGLLVSRIKHFPIELRSPRPLEEAISSAGGVCFSELNHELMLKNFPGVFLAGEMLDWDAPTGGFLIQACASQGYLAGQAVLRYIS